MSSIRNDRSSARCSLTQHSPTFARISCCHFLFTVAPLFFLNILLDEIKNLKCQLLIAATAGIEDTGNSPALPLFLHNQWVSTTTRETLQLPIKEHHRQMKKCKIIDSKYQTKNTDAAILVQYSAETLEIFFLKEAPTSQKTQNNLILFQFFDLLIKQKHFGSLLIYTSRLQPYQRDRSAHFFPWH